MIAANDFNNVASANLAPDQLRTLIATAAGLHAHAAGTSGTVSVLNNIISELFKADGLARARQCTLTPDALNNALDAAIEAYPWATRKEVLSRSRTTRCTRPRQFAMWFLRQVKLTNGKPAYSFPTIARAFGVDHTTVVHAERVVKDRIACGEIAA